MESETEKSKKLKPIMLFFGLFLGYSAYKQFDFELMRFKSAVAYVYIITSAFSLFVALKDVFTKK